MPFKPPTLVVLLYLSTALELEETDIEHHQDRTGKEDPLFFIKIKSMRCSFPKLVSKPPCYMYFILIQRQPVHPKTPNLTTNQPPIQNQTPHPESFPRCTPTLLSETPPGPYPLTVPFLCPFFSSFSRSFSRNFFWLLASMSPSFSSRFCFFKRSCSALRSSASSSFLARSSSPIARSRVLRRVARISDRKCACLTRKSGRPMRCEKRGRMSV